MGERPLFQELPEQKAPERPRGKARVQEPERNAIELRVVALDSLVASADRVRDVWADVETLDLTSLYTRIEAREGEPGRPAITPKLLMALWLCATLQGIGSARELAQLCEREIGFQWLCGGVGVNRDTLADFRVDNDALLDRLLSESVAVLVEEGLVKLDRLSLDGVRVRASAGSRSFHRGDSLKKSFKKATKLVAALRRELDDDPGAQNRRRRAAQERSAADRVERIKAAQRRLEALEKERNRRAQTNGNQTEKQKEPRASTTDPEARVMKMPDGGFRPAYNGRLIAEPTSGVILGVAVDTSGSDHGWVKPMVKQVKKRFGRAPRNCSPTPASPMPRTSNGRRGPGTGPSRCSWHQPRTSTGATLTAPARATGRVSPPGARMASEAGQTIYRLRALHECINAHLRQRRLYQLPVRGKAKAKTILLCHALAHNLARACALRRPALQPA